MSKGLAPNHYSKNHFLQAILLGKTRQELVKISLHLIQASTNIIGTDLYNSEEFVLHQ